MNVSSQLTTRTVVDKSTFHKARLVNLGLQILDLLLAKVVLMHNRVKDSPYLIYFSFLILGF